MESNKQAEPPAVQMARKRWKGIPAKKRSEIMKAVRAAGKQKKGTKR